MKEDDFKSGDRRDGGRPTDGRRDDARNTPRPRRDDQPGASSPRTFGADRRSDDRRPGNDRRDDNAGSRPFNREAGSDRRSGDRRDSAQSRPAFNRERDSDSRPFNRDNNTTGRSDERRDRTGGSADQPDRDSSRPSFDRDRNGGNAAPRSERTGNSRFGTSSPANRREEYPKPSFDRNSSPRWEPKGGNDRPRYTNDRRNDTPRSNDRRDTGPTPRFDNARSDTPRDIDQRSGDQRDNRDQNSNRFGEERSRSTSDERQRSGENRFGQERRYEERPKPSRERTDGPADARESRSRDTDARPYDRDRNSGPTDRRDERPRSFDRNDRPERSDRRFDKPADNRTSGPDRPRPYNGPSSAAQSGGFRPQTDRNDRPAPRRDDRRSGPSSEDRRTGRYDRAPHYDAEAMRNSIPHKKRVELERAEKHDNRNTEGTIRLNRYIANAGICSRREADELIAQGTVQVNGKVVTEMGHKVQPGDVVKYGNRILNPEKMVYVLLNKPKDYITTTEDPEERRTVMELVADAGPFRIYPVGRLDRNTTGLMLMTNDGELAEKLTHPSNEIKKIYQVELDKPITDEHFEAIQAGVELEDGLIKPDAVSIVTPDAQVVGIEIHSGRNRIVRRIFENFGYEVTKLDRTAYAGLSKKDLPRGKWRFLEPKEVVKLKYLQ